MNDKEETINQSNESYRILCEYSGQGILVADLENRQFVYANPRICQMFGYTKEEFLTLGVENIHPPEDLESVIIAFEAQAKKEKLLAPSLPCLRKDGSVFFADITTTPAHFNSRQCNLGFFTDVTDRLQIEEKLNLNTFVVENALDAIFLVGPDARFVYVNRSACESLGFTRQELLGKTVYDIDPAFPKEAWSEHFEEVKQRKSYVLQATHQHQDGYTFPVEIAVNHLALGDKEYNCAFARDIKERIKAEEALRLSEATYREVFNSVNDTIWIHDLDTFAFVDVNNRVTEMFGYSVEEALGLTVDDISSGVTPYNQETAIGLLKKAAAGESLVFDWHTRHKDGHLFWTEVSLRRATIAGKECILAVERNITERKQVEEEKLSMERQIQHAQKLESLGVLTGGIAHDFNNLLVGVLGNAELALLDSKPESPIHSYIQDIQTSSLRLAELTQQMLAYSGKGQNKVETLDFSNLVEEMLHLLERSISKKVTLKHENKANLVAIKADANQIRQVVMNLLTNAAESYGEESGIVTVNIRRLHADRKTLSEFLLAEKLPIGDYVLLEVSDNGSGMDKETCKKIFDPFFSTKFTGRGLGLAAVLGIIRSHCGAIRVSSMPKQGTTVRILLPQDGIECKEESDVSSDESLPFKGNGIILLVDDEEEVLKVGKQMLERMGYSVLSAVNGFDAVQQVRDYASELICVLLDLTMPRMDGIEAYSEIRKLLPNLPVVLCSGYDLLEASDQFSGKGITNFLQKPYKYQQLVEKLQEVLKN